MAEKVVTVYSVPTCPWCKKAKAYFTEKGVKFADINVAEDKAKLDEMVKLTNQRGVPVIVIGETTLIGFNEEKVAAALAA
jgi:glutaredoxin 3